MTFPMPVFCPTKTKAFSYLATITTSTGTTTRTFASADLGAAASDRLVIVTVAGTRSTSMTISSATINGVSATIIAQATKGGNSVNPTCAIIAATVPTGTSGDIVITLDVSPSTLRISTYRASGLSSSTVHATTTDASGSDTLDVNVPTQGLVVAVSGQVSVGSSTWSGITERTEASVNSMLHSFADSNGLLSASTPLAISASGGSTGNGKSISASWG